MMTAPALEREISALLVDDHRVFAEVLAMRLRAVPGIKAVEVAFSLGEARALVNKVRPDFVFLDFKLAEEPGLDLLPDLEALPRRPDVLMLSGAGDTRCIVEALHAGAQGWVTKDASFDVLIVATSEVLRGHMYLTPPTLKPVVLHLLAEAKGPTPEASLIDDLSRREVEVLRCLVSGMTRAEIADRLYLSVNTVRTHVQNLLHHADQHSTLALVALARGVGVTGVDESPAGPTPQRHPSSE